MDLRFEIQKITDRHYRVTHVKSVRLFDIHRLSPTGSQWVAFLIRDGKKEKHQFVSSDVSRKDLLAKIHNKIYAKPKGPQVITFKMPRIRKRLKKVRPFNDVPLTREVLKIGIRFSSTLTKEKFLMRQTADGWICTIIGAIGQQAICRGMESQEAAEMELMNYLDPGPQNAEEWAEYILKCFVRVK